MSVLSSKVSRRTAWSANPRNARTRPPSKNGQQPAVQAHHLALQYPPAQEHKPKWLLPSHREEIATTIQIARQAGGGPEIADLLRTLAKLLVPGMLAEVMDDRLPQEESDPFFDPQRFCEELRIITLELLEAGVVLPPDDEFFEQ